MSLSRPPAGRRMAWRAAASLAAASLVLACLIALPALSTPLEELTVERIYGDPSLSGISPRRLRWLPNGKGVTYLDEATAGKESEDGGDKDEDRALWLLGVPSGKKRILVRESELVIDGGGEDDDRTASLGHYAWGPEARRLLLPTKGDLYLYDLETKSTRRLTSSEAKETEAVISPDGARVAFVREHDLYVVELESGEETRLTDDGGETVLNGVLDWVYEEEFEYEGAYWWSPDSRFIAFLRFDESPVGSFPITDFLPIRGKVTWQHYPKAGDANPVVQVGVVEIATGRSVFMEIGDDPDSYVARVDWVPQGPRVAIQHLNRDQNRLDLLFGDPVTGATHRILTEESETFVNIRDQYHFFETSERFLWSSERDGWQHFYLYDLDGSLIRRLTEGPWMVTSLGGVDEKRGWVYFASTEASPVERQLYRVALNSGKLDRLSEGEGTHGMTLSPDARHYVERFSTNRHPPKVSLRRENGRLRFWIEENEVAELAEYGLGPPEIVTFQGSGGTTFYAEITKPLLFTPEKKYPVIVYVYGGPHAQVVRNAWGRSRYLWHQLMAQKGFVVFTMDNRGSFGRGKAFEDVIFRRMGQTEVKDQLEGIEFLKTLPYVDPDRIGVWGWSYGGYMTLLCLTKGGGAYKAGVSVAPVTNWRDYDTIYTERYMNRPQDNEEGYEDGAPVNFVGDLEGSLLLVHGTGDDNVHFANSVQMIDALIDAGKRFELMIYPGRTHGISDDPARIDLFERITTFFLENL